MASNPLTPIGGGFDLTTDFQTIFTPDQGVLRAGIDAIVFNNYSAFTTSITIRLSQAGTPDIFDEVVTNAKIRANDNFLAPGLIGQAILFGGILQAKVADNNRVNGKLTVTQIIS
jgi:hypothetical protein